VRTKVSEERLGNQEDTTQYHKLPLEAQLNVNADKLATAEIANHKKKDRLLHTTTNPHCYAYLVNGNTRQTHKEMEALRTNCSGSKIKEYFKTRFEYKSVTTIHSINWDSLEMARRKMSLDEQIYFLLTGWVATDTKKALYRDLVVGCHRCGGEETNDHMMQFVRKTAAQRETVVDFRAFLGKLGTESAAAEEMCHGIEDWLLSGMEGSTRTANSEDTREAAATQEKIGWGIEMRGLLAKQWGEIYQGPLTTGQLEGDVWTSQISLWLMRECHSYWRTRNEEREVTSSREEREKPRALANAEAGVRQLYSREMEVEEADRGIFAIPIERTLRTMLQWVIQTKATVNLMVSRREKRELENQPDICTAVTTVVTEEMEQASRAKQKRRKEQPKPTASPPRRRNTAAVTAQLRAARPKVCMIERIMGGYSALHKKRKKKRKRGKTRKKQPNKPRKTRQRQRRRQRKTSTSPERQEKFDRMHRSRTQ
jgi:hypothetical protein